MATIKDVAHYAGVSIMTVSRVINNPKKVSPKSRAKVMAAIEALDYSPNMFARGMVTGKSKTIGVMYSNLKNWIYADQIKGIEEVAIQRGYGVLLANIYDRESAMSAITMLSQMKVDGIIVLPMESHEAYTEEQALSAINELNHIHECIRAYFEQKDAKLGVAAGSVFLQDLLPLVEYDYYQGCKLAMDYLFDCGYTDIVYVSSLWDEGIWHTRQQAYTDAMTEHSCADRICVLHTLSVTNGCGDCACIRQYIQENGVPRAVLCANDHIAVDVIRVAQDLHIAVPAEMAVMGQDNLQIGEMVHPRLSTVDIHGEENGRAAATLLLNRIEMMDEQTDYISIGQSLCVRQTTE